MSLYLFEADGKLNSTCYDACAQAWPPLVTEAGARPARVSTKDCSLRSNARTARPRSPTMEGLFIISPGTKAPATLKARISKALARSGTWSRLRVRRSRKRNSQAHQTGC